MITLSDNKELSERQIKKEIAYQNRIAKETKQKALKTLSNLQKVDHKFIKLDNDKTDLFNNKKPEVPVKSKTMDEKMIEQENKSKTPNNKSRIKKLDTDIRTLGLS